ncbi:polysaccharide biosynthesis/export family protein [Roseisolibacter agri]|uniref:polysaccharide biosynthesis/export family protein n=1 Tax=Roseisolibacter agri TaxID=2014610 RepID=UPI0024E10679|nr:polysaccharide biosynthesis/export family protein [Roseisolibacter agri]
MRRRPYPRHSAPVTTNSSADGRSLAPRRARTIVAALGVLLAAAPVVRAQTPAGTPVPAPTAAVAGSDDPVGAGDKVVLRVWREPTWSDAYPVDATGFATLPRIGPMHVAGLAPRALRDSVRARLAVYLREPVVDVIVLRRVAVLGAVRKPDVLFVEPVSTVRDLIAQAGGIDEEGDPNRIEIVRDGERVRLGRWNDIQSTVAPVRSGDQIVVGRKGWFARNALAAVSSAAVAVSVLVSAFRR